MELITHILETRNGINIVKNMFVYPNEGNILENSQSYFSKSQKKEAKLNYKLSLKNKVLHHEERQKLVEHLVKQPFPKWNINLGFLS